MNKIKSTYSWFISNEKPLFCLIVTNIGIWAHFTFPFLFSGSPIHWVLGAMFIGGCIGFIAGLIPYFVALGLIRIGLVSPE